MHCASQCRCPYMVQCVAIDGRHTLHALLPQCFLEAFRYALGYEVQDDLAAISEISGTELLGAPANGEAGHKLQSRRALKVLAYLEDASNRACLLAWLNIVSSVTRLHYSLFKHARMTPVI